jgi:heme exporter protein C
MKAGLGWKWGLLPLMLVVVALCYLWAQDLNAFREPATARIIFWHVPMAWLGLLWFFVGAVHGLRYLYGGHRGSPEMDRKSAVANGVGLVCTVLATTTGMVFAWRQWGTPWDWDPKQVSITVLILIYMAYFGLRMSVEDPALRGRLAAVYALLAAVATPFLMFVIPQLPQIETLHPPGNTITGGLDAKWRTIYSLSALAFLGVTYWAFELRLRLEALEARREQLALAPAPAQAYSRTRAVRRNPAQVP